MPVSILSQVSGEYLPLDDYVADFNQMADQLTEPIWKLERLQSFREPGTPSWEAFIEGRWDESLALFARLEDELREYYNGLTAHGVSCHRVRVVEPPLTPYLQWELRVLAVRARAGELPRVVLGEAVSDLESRYGRLPELVIFGATVGYVVDYDADGVARGADRFTDADALECCRSMIVELYERGENLRSFVHREVVSLPPPDPGAT